MDVLSQHVRISPLLVWQPSVGPFTGGVHAFAESDAGTLFAYANSDIYRSRDDGVTWVRCPSQPQRLRSARYRYGDRRWTDRRHCVRAPGPTNVRLRVIRGG